MLRLGKLLNRSLAPDPKEKPYPMAKAGTLWTTDYVWPGVGALFETNRVITFNFHTGGNDWYGTEKLPAGTKFVVKERPHQCEMGWYSVVVLVNGKQAIVDIPDLNGKVKLL